MKRSSGAWCGAGAAVVWQLFAGAAPGQDAPTPEVPAFAEVATPLDPGDYRVGERIEDLPFVDLDGKPGRLSDFAESRALVVVLRDVGCPVGKQYGPRIAAFEHDFTTLGVGFLYINTSRQDSPDECRAEAELYGFSGRYAKDLEGFFGNYLRVRRTTDVFLLDAERRLRYRGAIDDQIGRGVTRPAATHTYLADALEAVLVGEEVPAPTATLAPGCILGPFPEPPPLPPPAITWQGRIRELVQARCQGCHHPGGGAPFPLIEPTDLLDRAAKVRAAVTEREMPPWFASAASGPFRNNPSLTDPQRRDLLRWLQSGAEEGAAAGTEALTAPAWPTDWRIGAPDLVIELPQAVAVPATGVVDDVLLEIEVPVPRDRWVQAIEIRPTCPEVVQQVIAQLLDPDRNVWLPFASLVPGQGPTTHADGAASQIKKGARLRLRLGYRPRGTACSDRTRIGIRFTSGDTPPAQVIDGWIVEQGAPDFTFFDPAVAHFTTFDPAGTPKATVVYELTLAGDVELLCFTPCMDRRGTSSRVELTFPDGTVAVPLDVPLWNPDWPIRYELETPIHAPAGTRIRVTTNLFDSSASNPFKPDPTASVLQTKERWNGMAGVFIEWAHAPGCVPVAAPEKWRHEGGEEDRSDDRRRRNGGG